MKAQLKIETEPPEKFRFRYRSEMSGAHGNLIDDKGNAPKVKLENFNSNSLISNAFIRCTIVPTNKKEDIPHPHHLVMKINGNEKCDPHDIEVSEENNYTAIFSNMGIIATAKKNVKDELIEKKRRMVEEQKFLVYGNRELNSCEEKDINEFVERHHKNVNLHSVLLCFQGFVKENGINIPVTEAVYSHPINNGKSSSTGELKICRISRVSGSCEGNDEIFILVERVGKKNIKIEVYEQKEDEEFPSWSAEGRFSELDVHHQYAIVFYTPPYTRYPITTNKDVFIRLRRMNDGDISNSMKFTYQPSERQSRRQFLSSIQIPRNNLPQFPNTLGSISPNNGSLSLFVNEYCDEKIKSFINSPLFREYNHLYDSCDDGYDSPNQLSETFLSIKILYKIFTLLSESESIDNNKSIIEQIKNLIQNKHQYGDTPLHLAIKCKQYEIANFFLKLISNNSHTENFVNILNTSKQTPLHLAAQQNNVFLVRALLELGADPNILDDDYATPLYVAVDNLAEPCVEEILKAKNFTKLDEAVYSGFSAIHCAVKKGSLFCLRALIQAGAEVNLPDGMNGKSVLHFAVENNDPNIVKYLLTETNIDIEVKDFEDNTALDLTKNISDESANNIIEMIKEHAKETKVEQDLNYDKSEHIGNEYLENGHSENEQLENKHLRNGNVQNEHIENGHLEIENLKMDVEVSDTIIENDQLPTLTGYLDDNIIAVVKSECDDDEFNKPENDILQSFEDSFEVNKNLSDNNVFTEDKVDEIMSELHLKQEMCDEGGDEDHDSAPANYSNEDEILNNDHIDKLTKYLDKSKIWEKLAYHTNHGSLVRLYRKLMSPSKSLLNKIKLAQPDITVRKMQDYLKELGEHQIAKVLDT